MTREEQELMDAQTSRIAAFWIYRKEAMNLDLGFGSQAALEGASREYDETVRTELALSLRQQELDFQMVQRHRRRN
jgi:hypothetical protein